MELSQHTCGEVQKEEGRRGGGGEEANLLFKWLIASMHLGHDILHQCTAGEQDGIFIAVGVAAPSCHEQQLVKEIPHDECVKLSVSVASGKGTWATAIGLHPGPLVERRVSSRNA